jgi:hypothetical protein
MGYIVAALIIGTLLAGIFGVFKMIGLDDHLNKIN